MKPDGYGYPPRLLRAERAARYLDISRSYFYELVELGVLPPAKHLRNTVLWDRLALDAAVDALDEPATERNSIDEIFEKLETETGGATRQRR